MPLKRLISIAFAAGLAASGCNETCPPQPQPLGLAAVISIDTVASGFGEIELPLRLTYTPEGRQLLDTLGEFRFLIGVERSNLIYKGFTAGDAISEWGYIADAHEDVLGDDGQTLWGIRITARRHGDDGRDQALPEGILATLRFRVPPVIELGGATLDVRFAANGCTDNTMCPERDLRIYYNADTSYGFASTDAAPVWMDCAPSLDLRPALGFHNGAVQVEEIDDTSLVAIITAEPVTAPLGTEFDVPITMGYPEYATHPPEKFGGLDLLIAYDDSGLQFLRAEKGEAISAWEYFTWRAPAWHCADCPPQSIRIVSIRDMNDGLNPNPPQYHPEGTIATLRFYAYDDTTLINTSYDVAFVSPDCGDNTISDLRGDVLYRIDPDDPRSDPRAVNSDPACLLAKPDHRVEEKLGFRSGKVTIGVP